MVGSSKFWITAVMDADKRTSFSGGRGCESGFLKALEKRCSASDEVISIE